MLSITKLIAAALALAVIASPAQAAKPSCKPGSADIKLRREWRTLTPNEKANYFKGIDAVLKSGFYDELAKTHNAHNGYIHSNAIFLPWHRAFTVELEMEMRKTTGPDFALPYWDWGYDSQAPELAPHWGDGPDQFGNGGDPKTNCVTTGHFANRKTKYPRAGECLKREFGARMDPVTSTDLLNRIMSTSKTYNSFRTSLEGAPHGGVHVAIGGDMAHMTSPNDPVFFLHHVMVDKVWSDWQKLNNGANKNLFGGKQVNYRADLRFSGSHEATAQDVLYPYPDWTVADTFDTEAICFKYVDLNIKDVRIDALPPPTVKLPTTGTQPTAPPATQPATPSRPATPPPTSNDSRRRRDDDDDDDRKPKKDSRDSTASKITGFFTDLFNADQADPSQAPVGADGTQRQPAPVDSSVTLGFDEKAAAQVVDSKDRSELIKLRTPTPLPDSWIAMNSLDATEVRTYESQASATIKGLNAIFGYVSPSALWNQAEKLAKLTKSDVTNFKATLTSVVVNVENTAAKDVKDAKQAVVDLHARVKLSIGFTHIQNVDKVRSQVTKLIGGEIYGKDSLSNPFYSRH